MACSKILTGDLPELTYQIVKYLKDDLNSLHSCVLVNRNLCRVTIPMLWEDPFSVICRKDFRRDFLSIYLESLEWMDKDKLKKF